jgi:hypothetical protein
MPCRRHHFTVVTDQQKGRSDAKELADFAQHFDGGFSSALLPFAVPLGLNAEHFRKVLGVFKVQ